MGALLQDLRYGLRMLVKNPCFTAAAIVTLALGIGANTAIFSVVNTVLLRALPYKDADHLVMVWSYNRPSGQTLDLVSAPDLADWRSQNHVFQAMAASTDFMYTLTGAGEPTTIIGYQFSPEYFRVLGVAPLLGRTFLPEENQPGKNHVAVLNWRLWQSRFGGDRGIVGKTATLDGEPYTIVGVMPHGVDYPGATQLWTPLTVPPGAATNRNYRYLRVIARLKPGVAIQQAQAEMNAIASRLAREYPKTNKDEDATNIISLRQTITGDIRPALLVLFAAVGFVLLITCANVGNLLLARAVGRQKEIAVRAALGASRARLVRQLLTESVLLGLVGGTLGLFLASWGAEALVAMFPPTIANLNIPRVDHIPVDGWVLSFALAASLLTGVIFGLIPALHSCGPNLDESLKESGRSSAGSTKGGRFRGALVVSEVALSVILLTAAGLTMKSFLHLLRGDLGFNSNNVLTMRVLLPGYGSKYYPESAQLAFGDQTIARIKVLPGVQAVGAVTFLPLSGWWGSRQVSVEGQEASPGQKPDVVWSSATPDYFRAMGIPLIQGRFFGDQDAQGAPPVAVISKSLARRLWPTEDAVGKRIAVEGLSNREVIGVVGDVRQLGLTSEKTSEVYIPLAQVPGRLFCFAIRTASDPISLAKAAQGAIWEVDKDQAVGYVMSLGQLTSESLAPQRVISLLLGVFAGLALLLAAGGMYGVISYSAVQRTHEIGIRVALGARAADVLRLVVGQGLTLAFAGVAIGLAGALGLMRLLASLLYGVCPSDPFTLISVAAVLAVVALVASYIPARRATRVDPMVALRFE
jgi:putative ABC transport system permease protein